MRKVVYLGYSAKMIRGLMQSNMFQLEHVIGVKGRLSEEYYAAVEQSKAGFTEITSKQELIDNAKILDKGDIIIMHKFEFIIPQEIVSKHRFFNFHGGDLRTNRGAHAPVWSVLLREDKTCLSCYQLNYGTGGG